MKPELIFICGLGGTGKSTFAKKLHRRLGKDSLLVELDWFCIDSSSVRKKRILEAIENNLEEEHLKKEIPQFWCDEELLMTKLLELQRTSNLKLESAWNQQNGEKDICISINGKGSEKFIICEGIYLLHPEIADTADKVVLLEISDEDSIRRSNQRDSYRNPDAYQT